MRLWLLILIILIANVFIGPVLWAAVGIWGGVAIYSHLKKIWKESKI